MSILTEPLPDGVEVAGRYLPIETDFRTMLRIDELIHDEDLSEDERGVCILGMFYGCIPEPVDEATKAMIWFFRCGKDLPEAPEGDAGGSGGSQPDFSYKYDAELIYAAFLDQYGIDLTREDLHWWRFRALFEALKPDHVFSEIRKCRAVKLTKDMPKEVKAYYKAMKKLYALPRPEQEQKAIDEVTAALMGDGNVMGVLYGEDEKS